MSALTLPYSPQQVAAAAAELFRLEALEGRTPLKVTAWSRLTWSERREYFARAEGIIRDSYGLPSPPPAVPA